MKIGTALIGLEIKLDNWVLLVSWWWPVPIEKLSERDRARIQLCGFSRDEVRNGIVTTRREVRSLSKDSTIT